MAGVIDESLSHQTFDDTIDGIIHAWAVLEGFSKALPVLFVQLEPVHHTWIISGYRCPA